MPPTNSGGEGTAQDLSHTSSDTGRERLPQAGACQRPCRDLSVCPVLSDHLTTLEGLGHTVSDDYLLTLSHSSPESVGCRSGDQSLLDVGGDDSARAPEDQVCLPTWRKPAAEIRAREEGYEDEEHPARR